MELKKTCRKKWIQGMIDALNEESCSECSYGCSDGIPSCACELCHLKIAVNYTISLLEQEISDLDAEQIADMRGEEE